jgi:hypothetical protein
MEILMDSQLELELYKPDEDTKEPNALLPAFEGEKRKEISQCVGDLEKYLGAIIEDYDEGDEGHYAKVKRELGIKGPSSQIPLRRLPRLQLFIDTEPFKRDFARPVHKLAKQVKEETERAHSNGEINDHTVSGDSYFARHGLLDKPRKAAAKMFARG